MLMRLPSGACTKKAWPEPMSPTVRFATIPVTRRGRAGTGGLGSVETHLEHERSVDQLEQGLSGLTVLYLKLASAHLGLDYRGGFMLAPGGFDHVPRHAGSAHASHDGRRHTRRSAQGRDGREP